MQKLIGIIISIIVIAGCITGVIFLVNRIQEDNKDHTLTVSTTEGGKVFLTIGKDEDTITHDANEVFTVKNSTNIKLVANEFEGYDFIKWTLNDKDKSTNTEINIKISKNSTIKAIFAPETANLTINDGEFTESFEHTLSSNLLYVLNNKYTAPAGYKYIFKINNELITDSTTIAEDTAITREKVLIEYTVTFKHNGEQVGDILTYTVENKNITAPSVPTETGYTTVWESYTLDNLGNIVVNSIATPIDYTIEFSLPNGYTFADGSNKVSAIYHITDNYTNITKPDLSSITNIAEHYAICWPESATLSYSDTAVSIVAEIVPIKYSVTFMNGNDVIAVEYYTIENQTITAPDVNTIKHYKNMSWTAFDTSLLTNQISTLNKTPIDYTVTFDDGINEPIVRTYNIENQTISDIPELPVIEHYKDIKWSAYDLSTLTDINVTIEKTPIDYNITFVLCGDYKFEDESTSVVLTYNVENMSELTNPELPTPREGYSLVWSEYTIVPGEELTVNAVESALRYAVTFIHEGNQVGETQYYTVEECNIVSPVPPTENGYYIAWEAYNISTSAMTDVVVNSIKLIEVSVVPDLTTNGINYYNTNNYKYSTIYTKDNKAYETILGDEYQVREIANLATTLDNCIVDSLGNYAIVSQIAIKNGESTIQTIDVNGNLSEKLTEALSQCISSSISLSLIYSAK